MNAYSGFNNAGNAFSPVVLEDYKEMVTYDANGNIKTYTRHRETNPDGLAMDSLTYQYERAAGGQLTSNRLRYVHDAVASTYTEDIESHTLLTLAQMLADNNSSQGADNFGYDAMGNLTRDAKEGITGISWTVYGKIASITKNGSTISYSYDAGGNRISKTAGGRTTWYVRDASGNVMSIYETGNSQLNNGELTQTEAHLYGSSRLGIFTLQRNVENPASGTGGIGIFERGGKFFELGNHLGNVLVTISDKKIGHDAGNGTVDYYTADVVTASDYLVGGMDMPGKELNSSSYRYSINGQEKEKELNPNITSAEFWMYDSRLVRRWNRDPIFKAAESPYAAFGNNPVLVVDPNGADTLTFTRNLYRDNRSPHKGRGVRPKMNYELQGSIDIKAGGGPDVFYYTENVTTLTDNGKDFSSTTNQFNPQGQFPYMSGGRTLKGFHDDQYALGAMAPDWLLKFYYNKSLASGGDWPTTKAWGTALAYKKDMRFAKTLKNISDIIYLSIGAGALLKGALTPAIAEAFPTGFTVSQFEGFYIRSASTMANGTYTKTIQTLAFMGESGSGNLTKLVRSIEIEARTAGAKTLQINGIEVVNPRILSTSRAAAEKFGYTFEQITENSIRLTKALK